MKQDLEKKLQDNFPNIKLPQRGCECDDGWYDLLGDLFFHLQTHLLKSPIDFEITQIKQKYSSLRIYYTGGDNVIDYWVSKFETASERICELCGRQGTLCSKGSWLKTLCDKCAKEKDYERSSSTRVKRFVPKA